MNTHGPAFRGSESQTRYALIDPLLTALGWDISDPSQVVPEYSAGAGRADYALLEGSGKPALMVEAKRLDRPLQDGLSQSIAYCVEQGTPYFCVSDGRRWAVYETFRPVAVHDKLVTKFDLLEGSSAEACLKALALWRPSVLEGHVREGNSPVVKTDAGVFPPADPPKESEPAVAPAAASQHEGTWVGLMQVPSKKGTSLPQQIQLPDGTTKGIDSWGGILTEITRWLVERGEIKTSSLPLQAASDSYILATSPIGPTGKRFRNAQQFGDVWLAPHGNIHGVLQKAQRIIEHAGRSPAEFKFQIKA